MWESSRCEVLDTLTTLWESFQVGRALSLSPNDRKPRPMEESMELNSCRSVRGMRKSGLECVWLYEWAFRQPITAIHSHQRGLTLIGTATNVERA